jgi:SSS family solute:Na+ symporter
MSYSKSLYSLLTRPKADSELRNLVYGLARIPSGEAVSFYRRPIFAAALVAAVFVLLNIIFW